MNAGLQVGSGQQLRRFVCHSGFGDQRTDGRPADMDDIHKPDTVSASACTEIHGLLTRAVERHLISSNCMRTQTCMQKVVNVIQATL